MQIDNKKKLIISIILIIGIIIAFVIYTVTSNSYNEMSLESIISNEEILIENENKIENIEENQTQEIEEIAIHIVGEVKNEGIVYLEKGSRIIDAIEKAGGETKEADLSQINLAYELQDGQKIYIPNKKEKISEYITMSSGNNVVIEENTSQNNNKGEENKVNINTANQSELDSLPGIGPSLAQRIIEYREPNGNFQKIEDLQNVKGIGDAKYSDIKDNVTV